MYHTHTHLLLFFTVGVQESVPPHTPLSLLHRWSSREFTITHTSFSSSQVEFRRVYHHTHLLLFFTVRVQESLPPHTPLSLLHRWSSGEFTNTHTPTSSSLLHDSHRCQPIVTIIIICFMPTRIICDPYYPTSYYCLRS